MTAYKIVERKDGLYHTLFHTYFNRVLGRTRRLPWYTWLIAEQRENVSDGTSKTTYTSGWHVIPDYEYALEYLKRFKDKPDRELVILEVRTFGFQPKPTNPRVLLCREICIIGRKREQ